MGQDIDKEIIEMLAKMTGFEPSEITLEMNIVRDLGVDSLKVIEIATAIEQKFKVVVKESDMAKISSVGQAIAVVKKLIERKQKVL